MYFLLGTCSHYYYALFSLKSCIERAMNEYLHHSTSVWPVVALLGQIEIEGSLQFTGLRCLAALRQSSLALAVECAE